MFNIIVYFFRQNIEFLYSGLLIFGSLYSYIISIYFFNSKHDLLIVILIFTILWNIFFIVKFSKNREIYTYEMQKERYSLLRHKITQEYKLDIEDNIFSKIDLIISLIKDKFSVKGLMSIRTLKLINSSLGLYVDNLKIKNQLLKANFISNSRDKQEFYQDKINKNIKQNNDIEDSLDNLIIELMLKNNNNLRIEYILNEFEDSTKLLSKII